MKVLVIGSGLTVVDDLWLARQLFTPDLTIGINQAALMHGPVDLHVTLHPEEFAHRKVGRLIAHKRYPGVDEVFEPHTDRGCPNSGSSGMYATRIARAKGGTHVVLAGVPITVEPHDFGGAPWRAAQAFRETWRLKKNELVPYVRSMSGWTRELLGAPTPEWLQGP